MKRAMFLVYAALISVACTASYLTGSILTIKHYERYFMLTEKLLDEIDKTWDSFGDTVGETDLYEEYQDSREFIIKHSQKTNIQ